MSPHELYLLPKTERIEWIDILKGICMIVIIMNHIPGVPECASRFFYPFELVGFFFIGGVTFSLKKDFWSFLKSKFLRLVFPVLAFGILNLLLSLPFKDVDITERIKGIFFQIPGKWDDMWFVACLFVMQLIYYPIERFLKKIWLKIVITFLGCVMGIVWTININIPLPWHIVNAFLFLPIFHMGKVLTSSGLMTYLGKKLDGKEKFYIVLISGLYCISVWAVDNWPIDVHILLFGNPIIFVISAVLGLWSIIGISAVIGKSTFCFFKSVLLFIGANTLVYYGLQSKLISIFDTALKILSLESKCDWLLILILVLSFLWPLTLIINRWLPFMTGNFSHIKINH